MTKLLKGSRLVLAWTTLFVAACCSFSPAVAKPKGSPGGPGSGQTFNVLNYGAVGDNSHDDSLAISKAIAAANASPGSTVLFPANYAFLVGSHNPVLRPQGITLLGGNGTFLNLGDSTSQIVLTGSNTAIKSLTIDNEGSSQTAVSINGAQNYSISGNTFLNFSVNVQVDSLATGTITGNSFSFAGAQSTGVYLKSVNSATVTNNSFVTGPNAFLGYGIYTTDARVTLTMTGNTFKNLAYGVYANVGSGATQKANVVFDNNTVSKCTTGLACEYMGTLSCNTNTFNNNTTSIYAYLNTKETISNNTFTKATTFAIETYVTGEQDNTISGNKILTLGTLATGIYLQGASADNPTVISNNTISGVHSGNGAAGTGIEVTEINKCQVTTNTISNCTYGIYSTGCNRLQEDNNVISNMNLAGVYSTNDAADVEITSNKISNCGLISGAYAVIYVNAASSSSVDIRATNNSYTASGKGNLSYFVYMTSAFGQGNLSQSGNTTNTMLPSIVK